MMDPNSGTPIIILKDVQSDTMLPIWVGAYEANAIALEIEKIAPPRPMTHDLLRNLIIQLGVQVERGVVTRLQDNTFFAEIEMRNSDGNLMRLDSRPSDAIALALRADCPIFVDMEVIKASRNTIPAEEVESLWLAKGFCFSTAERFKQLLWKRQLAGLTAELHR